MRQRLLSILLSAIAASGTTAPALAQAPDAARPTLVVFFTVDQMRPDYFTRFALSGGLKRLYDGGAFFTNAFHDHANTETAPGHSVTMSGRFPRSTGIVSNSRGVNDPASPLIGGGGDGASPLRFRGTTLTDWLRASSPNSRTLSVSRKDRGAILPVGKSRQDVYWYSATGRFTTSTYYRDTLPTWVEQFNARRSTQQFAGRKWDLMLDASQYSEPDSIGFENRGQNYLFPHWFPTDSDAAARQFAAFPMMDSLTLQFALSGLEAMNLGRGPQPDILAISLSTTDAVGHAFGPDSRELHDQILRLDRYLGMFLDSLFRVRDSSRIVFALTADHAVAPYPEVRAINTGELPVYADAAPVIQALRRDLAARGIARAAFRFEEEMVFIDRPAFAAAKVNADSVLTSFAMAMRAVPGVQFVERVKALASHDTTRDYIARRWIHMLPPDFPAELVVSLQPFAYWEGATNATHGTPHDYDAHVPVLFYGPMIKPGKFAELARVVDMAPTLAQILGLTPLESVDGRVLRAAIR
jgi:predicted AlkP superfamily pyrophosphatase or phosphodiesterase